MIAVDLDKVFLAVCKGCNEEFSEEPCEPGFCMIRSAIEDVPTLTLDDLRPKGRWLNVRLFTTGDGRVRLGDCSCCGSAEKLRDFCPACGANMRGYMSDGQRNQEG